MKHLAQKASAILLAFAFVSILSIGINSDANAQPAPLAVANTSAGCAMWAQGVVYNPMCGFVCVTPWMLVPVGGVVMLPPCGGAMDFWASVNYEYCAPLPPGCGLPVGSAPNFMGMGCGIPPVLVPDCLGAVPIPAWGAGPPFLGVAI